MSRPAGARAIPPDSVAFRASGRCPECGAEVIMQGLWPTSWGPRPAIVVTHLPPGEPGTPRHRPEFADAVPMSAGLLRHRQKPRRH